MIAAVAPASAGAAPVSLFNQSFENEVLSLPFDPEIEPKSPGWVWTGYNGEGTLFERVRDPDAPHGEWVLKVFTDGSNGKGGVHSPSSDVAAGEAHTVRMLAKVPAGRELEPSVSERRADDSQIIHLEDEKVTGTGDWQLIEVTRTFGPEGVKIRGYWELEGAEPGTFYLDAYPPDMESPDPDPDPDPEPDPDPDPDPIGPPAPAPAGQPPAAPPLRPLIDLPPRIIGFSATPARFLALGGRGSRGRPTGTHFVFTISEPARATITIRRGNRRRGAAVATMRVRTDAGQQSVAFAGRARRRPLAPGRYLAAVVARDAGGKASAPRYVGFRILAAQPRRASSASN